MNKRIVFIGHSIINGYPLSRNQCFVGLLKSETSIDIINQGANGETTSDIMRRFTDDAICLHPDMIFIMSGTNDFIYNEATVQEVYDGLIKMASAANACGITPVLITPLPVDPDQASIMWMSGIDYDNINSQLTQLSQLISGSPYETVDLNNTYRQFGQFIDGLHPTAAGHRFMANIISEYIKSKGAF